MNPRHYDLDELKGIAGLHEAGIRHGDPDGRSNGDDRTATDAADALSSSQYRELLLLQGATSGELTKPYLERLPETYAAELAIFEWLEFLLESVGFRRTLEVLRYYRTIGWLTADVEEELGEYLRAFNRSGGGPGSLSRSDHVQSLIFIARLAAIGEE